MAARIVLPWTLACSQTSNAGVWASTTDCLDEFVFRFNRRRTRHVAFHTRLGIAAQTAPAPYHLLIKAGT
jgi:hypothetical protein